MCPKRLGHTKHRLLFGIPLVLICVALDKLVSIKNVLVTLTALPDLTFDREVSSVAVLVKSLDNGREVDLTLTDGSFFSKEASVCWPVSVLKVKCFDVISDYL